MTSIGAPSRFPRSRRVLAAALTVACALAGVASARADEPPPVPAPAAGAGARPALERLSKDEIEVVRRRFPDWDQLDAPTKERIAGAVIKLRSLSPEQRARFLERMRKLDRAGPMAVENVAKNMPAFAGASPERREEMVRVHQVTRAILSSFVADWPAGTREELFGSGTGALSPQERMHLAMCVGIAWRRRALEALVAAPPLDVEPAEGTPDVKAAELVTLRDQVRAGGGPAAAEPLRRRYAARVYDDRMLRAKATIGRLPSLSEGDAGGLEAHLAAWGAKVRAAFPDASTTVGADLAAAAETGRDGLAAFCEKNAPERPPMRQRALWELLFQLEAKRRDLSGDVLVKTDELEASIFAALRVPDERARALRAATQPFLRMRLLRLLFDDLGPQAPRDRGRGPKDDRRDDRRGERPDAKNDAPAMK